MAIWISGGASSLQYNYIPSWDIVFEIQVTVILFLPSEGIVDLKKNHNLNENEALFHGQNWIWGTTLRSERQTAQKR